MRQATLKLKMYAPNANMTNNPGNAFFFFFRFFYNLVFKINERQGVGSGAHTLINQVGELELTYLYMSSSLDLDLSRSMGFKEAKANFAVRQPFGLVSKSNSNEI